MEQAIINESIFDREFESQGEPLLLELSDNIFDRPVPMTEGFIYKRLANGKVKGIVSALYLRSYEPNLSGLYNAPHDSRLVELQKKYKDNSYFGRGGYWLCFRDVTREMYDEINNELDVIQENPFTLVFTQKEKDELRRIFSFMEQMEEMYEQTGLFLDSQDSVNPGYRIEGKLATFIAYIDFNRDTKKYQIQAIEYHDGN